MATPDANVSLVRKASLWSYVMGIWFLLSVVVLMGTVVALVLPLMSIMGPMMTTPTTIASLYQMLNSFMLALGIVLGITTPIMLIFGYYSYRVGTLYDVGSLKLAGFCSMIMALGFPILIYGLYEFLGVLYSMVSLPPTVLYSTILGSIGLLLLGAAIVGLFGFIFFIAFIIGTSGMKRRTGISSFSTAMWLAIVGLFISFLIPIAIIVFASGLSSLSKLGTTRPTGRAAPTEAPRAPARRETVYCPYCGAKVEPDALFCQSCGSSLKKEE